MDTQKKYNIFSSCIKITKYFFTVAVAFLIFFGIAGQIVLPDERDTISTDCRLFETTWSVISDNGTRTPISVPGKVDAERGEVVSFVTTLPASIQEGEYLCFRTIWQNVAVYVNGELRQYYNTEYSRPFGTNSTTRYIFIELEEKDAGKELLYQCSSNSKYAGDIRETYIGDRLSIWIHLMQNSGMHALIAVFLLLMSLACILVCLTFQWLYKNSLPLRYLAWTIFFCALWMLTEMAFRQIVVKNISVLSCYAYWSLMMIPIALILYLNEIQHRRYQKFFTIPLVYSAVIFVVCTLLQIFDIFQFVETLFLVHIGMLVAIIGITTTITIDAFKKQLSDYLFVGIGVYGMLATGIMELAIYYIGTSLSMGTILAIGLLFLLIMAIIKTGQDLFYSEKKKQQAIMAKEAQSQFLANMSHEIRTPINAIIGMNEMILRECETASIQEYAHNVQSASNMLLGLINDVLDFSKIESGQLELVEDTYSFASMMQDEILLLQARAAGKPISTQLDINYGIPTKLYGDEIRIKQILTNLLSNAVKYTPQGTVTLKAFSKQIDADHSELWFSVTDTGIGIKEEDIPKLFTSFKRLELSKNRAIQGTGLGLNITKQLVELMQGTITVESEYGKGSTFSVAIPQKVVDWQPVGNLEESLNKWRKEHEVSKTLFTAPNASILIVDDNSTNLSLMKGLLKRTKIQIDVVTSGKDCLEFTKHKKYHLIFMDHMMPELDGVETLHLLREDSSNPNQNTFVIALTANAIAGCREMYLNYGFNDYFAKPIQADKLEALIRKNLPKKLVLAAEAAPVTPTATATPATPVTSVASPVTQNTPEPAVSSATSSSLFDIDREAGLSYCLNSEELYQTVLTEFCKETTGYLDKLDLHFQNEDWKNYAIIAHGLKSSARHIGATNFSELSLKHELAGKEENADFIKAEFQNYINAIKGLIKKLEESL